MGKATKIEVYQKAKRVYELAAGGHTTHEIAAILTDELKAAGVADSISQPAVSRFLKAYRELQKEAATEARQKATDRIVRQFDTEIESDLEIIKTIQRHFYLKFKGLEEDLESGEILSGGFSRAEREASAKWLAEFLWKKIDRITDLETLNPEEALKKHRAELEHELDLDLKGKIIDLGRHREKR
jgi:predicted transcriptional regulator